MSTSPITWNTCPQYAKMQSWGGSKQGGPRCRWTCSWALKTMSSAIPESHFNFFDLVPCIMFLTHLQLLLWKFYGSSTPLLNHNPCSLFPVLSTRFIIHVSCHHSPDFSYNLCPVWFWKGLPKFTNPCLQIHKSHKYPDFPLARYFHSHKKSKVWLFRTCSSILSVLLVPYLQK